MVIKKKNAIMVAKVALECSVSTRLILIKMHQIEKKENRPGPGRRCRESIHVPHERNRDPRDDPKVVENREEIDPFGLLFVLFLVSVVRNAHRKVIQGGEEERYKEPDRARRVVGGKYQHPHHNVEGCMRRHVLPLLLGNVVRAVE